MTLQGLGQAESPFPVVQQTVGGAAEACLQYDEDGNCIAYTEAPSTSSPMSNSTLMLVIFGMLGLVMLVKVGGEVMRLEGLGQSTALGIGPGNPCYDPTHDAGLLHCATASSVVASAINPFSTQMTTNCSASEQACLLDPDTAGAAADANAPDICSQTIGMSCTEAAMFAALLIAGIVVAEHVL